MNIKEILSTFMEEKLYRLKKMKKIFKFKNDKKI